MQHFDETDRSFSITQFYEQAIIIYFVKSFTDVQVACINSSIILNKVINDITNGIDSMCTTRISLKLKTGSQTLLDSLYILSVNSFRTLLI